ncbi:hypothetical protein [Meiothermus sp. CFH 77666]|uniref:hypothetical protein n=1 Tax=Meiothermus sp. CFH 77666 TaxID=2817942 RepID=UPI001FB12923|nr:hypothetical protein [Meiothermus sp. CFH 77666]
MADPVCPWLNRPARALSRQGIVLSLRMGNTCGAADAGEAAAAHGRVVRMEGLGVDWILTGDAALCNPELAAAVVERKGEENQAKL